MAASCCRVTASAASARVLVDHRVHVALPVAEAGHGVVHVLLGHGGHQGSTSHACSVLPIEVILEIY